MKEKVVKRATARPTEASIAWTSCRPGQGHAMSTANAYLTVRGIDVEVVFKDIKNLHIGVYPPCGRVRVAAPGAWTKTGSGWQSYNGCPGSSSSGSSSGCRPPVRAGNDLPASRTTSGVPASACRSSSAPAAPTSKPTTIACCCTCRKARTGKPARGCSIAGTASQLRQAIPPLISHWEPIVGCTVTHGASGG